MTSSVKRFVGEVYQREYNSCSESQRSSRSQINLAYLPYTPQKVYIVTAQGYMLYSKKGLVWTVKLCFRSVSTRFFCCACTLSTRQLVTNTRIDYKQMSRALFREKRSFFAGQQIERIRVSVASCTGTVVGCVGRGLEWYQTNLERRERRVMT